jgi:outer membrane protein OmpA-like peptidoglycan-associated protein
MAACAEVELVHAGNEQNQQGWRHAKPYVQIAEDLVTSGSAAAASCPDAPAIVTAPVLMPAARTVAANVLFEFDHAEAAAIRAESRAALDHLIAELREARVTSATIVGHADRMNSTGNAHYNDTLARRRAETIATLLVEAGADRSTVHIDSHGDAEPVVDCKGSFASPNAREDCLLANRRVRVEVVLQPGR